MTIQEAIVKKISKIRKPFWANKEDYLQLDLFDDGEFHGPWMHLYSPTNQIIGAPNPQTFLWSDDGKDDWEEFKAKE
jgi:hypothetical protein